MSYTPTILRKIRAIMPKQLRQRHLQQSANGLHQYPLDPLPETPRIRLRKGDHLAICGDSITEQRLYSVLVETYLTGCHPELDVSCRQFGLSGEQAGGFRQRMEADVLRFHPTIATICYGMNDFRYVPHDREIEAAYLDNQTAILRAFEKTGCRVLLGSPTIIDTVPEWVKTARGSVLDLNQALCRFRNATAHLAKAENVAFADLFLPMLEADISGKARYGERFKIAGKDGVHPGWAGQLIMAYAFINELQLTNEIAHFTLDVTSGEATVSDGHERISSTQSSLRLLSNRLPFFPGKGRLDNDDSVRAGMEFVPFHDRLNRFMLSIRHPQAASYHLTWGNETRLYSAGQLEAGINLAKDFQDHPLAAAFMSLWDAVALKQAYETRQFKNLLRGAAGSAEREESFKVTEETRSRYVHAIQSACRPVDHELILMPVSDK